MVNGRVAIAAGGTIAGRVVAVQPAQKLRGRAQLDLEFTSRAAVGGAALGHALGKDRRATVLGALVGALSAQESPPNTQAVPLLTWPDHTVFRS
jgi:hypothetical protein